MMVLTSLLVTLTASDRMADAFDKQKRYSDFKLTEYKRDRKWTKVSRPQVRPGNSPEEPGCLRVNRLR